MSQSHGASEALFLSSDTETQQGDWLNASFLRFHSSSIILSSSRAPLLFPNSPLPYLCSRIQQDYRPYLPPLLLDSTRGETATLCGLSLTAEPAHPFSPSLLFLEPTQQLNPASPCLDPYSNSASDCWKSSRPKIGPAAAGNSAVPRHSLGESLYFLSFLFFSSFS